MTKKHRVVLTRTEHDIHGLEAKYSQVEWIEFPLIKFEYQSIDPDILQGIQSKGGMLVFTSQNAVKSFFQQVEGPVKHQIACVGPKTANLVNSFGQEVNFIPSQANSFVLATELGVNPSTPITYIGGNLSSAKSLNVLKEKTNTFTQVESYKTLKHEHSKEDWQSLVNHRPDLISFCSPSAVMSFKDQIVDFDLQIDTTIRFAAIGLTTQSAIQKQLKKEAICPEKHTFKDMIASIVNSL